MKILAPTEYNQIKEDKTKNNNQQLDNNTSKERIALYQTIQLNRNQLNKLQTSNLISNKRKLKLIQNITDIDNKQSTLQHTWFNRVDNNNTKPNNISEDAHGTNYIDRYHHYG